MSIIHKAGVTLRIPGSATLDGIDELVEEVRKTAHPILSGRTLLIQWSAPNAWDLRGQVEETLEAVESLGMYIDMPDTVNVGDGTDTDLSRLQRWTDGGFPVDLDVPRLLRALAGIKRSGYQPMYNGRPSCPFCQHFVDEEQTHHPACVLLPLA